VCAKRLAVTIEVDRDFGDHILIYASVGQKN